MDLINIQHFYSNVGKKTDWVQQVLAIASSYYIYHMCIYTCICIIKENYTHLRKKKNRCNQCWARIRLKRCQTMACFPFHCTLFKVDSISRWRFRSYTTGGWFLLNEQVRSKCHLAFASIIDLPAASPTQLYLISLLFPPTCQSGIFAWSSCTKLQVTCKARGDYNLTCMCSNIKLNFQLMSTVRDVPFNTEVEGWFDCSSTKVRCIQLQTIYR